MINFQYDEEAVIQDADVLMAQEDRRYRRQLKAMRQGICFHDAWLGRADDGTVYYPEQELLIGDQVICQEMCKKIFDSEYDLIANRLNLAAEWNC